MSRIAEDPKRSPSRAIEDALQIIRNKAASLRFGTIVLTMHEGRLTQLDVNERCRFTP